MMTDPDRGTDRAVRRAKRFLTPLQKYEIFLQLVRQEVTLAEVADNWKWTARRYADPYGGQGRRPGGVGQLSSRGQVRERLELEAARAGVARLGDVPKEMAVKLMLVEGKERWG